jgi:two-component system, OmpR family, response regulator
MTIKKSRVLIIDDEAGFTRLLKLNLHHTGKFVTETVNDPTRALAVASEFEPDLILLDVMMPSMDGGEVASRLQAVPKLRATPIVFLTAAVKRSEINAHQGLIGGLPFLAKPVELQELLECIDKNVTASP